VSVLRDPLRPLPTIRRLRELAGALGIAHELLRRERWSRLELEAFQRRRLSALVRYAIEHSRFYRDLYGPVPPSGAIDLEALPIVSKTLMMDNFDWVVTDPRLRLEELEHHVAELEDDDSYLGEYRVLSTSGSTGGRALFVYGRREWSTSLAGFLRYATLLERPPRLPRLKLAAIGGPSPLHQSNRVAASLDVGAYRMLRLPVTVSVSDLVGALNAFQPDVLNVYPSIAALLADEQRQGRLDIHPLTISTSSEMGTDEMRRKIRGAWCVEPFNLYAASETGVLAVDCSHHRGLHLFEDLSIVEIVDEAGRPVPAGSGGHKLLVTNLFNYTQPLIRYEISDMLTMSLEHCPCGRPFRLIGRIEGRNDDIFYLLHRDGKRIPVHPAHLHAPLEASAEVRQYQIVHDAAGIHVRLVLVNGVSAEEICTRVRAS
jgi:phenylacetate-coenzyme A ligase PaaK-like adenylate-forming protein